MRSAPCAPRFEVYFDPNSSCTRHLSVSVSFCCQLCSVPELYHSILSFRNFSIVDFREMAEEAPELKRDSTMTVTAKVRERSKAREHRKILNPKVPQSD